MLKGRLDWVPDMSLHRPPPDWTPDLAVEEGQESPQALRVLGGAALKAQRTGTLQSEASEAKRCATRTRALEGEVRERWPVERIGVIHRLGHLELGDISVAVAVSCAHRQAAFEAGKFMIDQLKLVVPIWKKENWSDGTTEWVHPQTDEAERINAAVPPTSEDRP